MYVCMYVCMQAKHRGGKLQKVSVTISSKFIKIQDIAKQVWNVLSVGEKVTIQERGFVKWIVSLLCTYVYKVVVLVERGLYWNEGLWDRLCPCVE